MTDTLRALLDAARRSATAWQKDYDGMRALAQAASDDAERAIQRACKAELALRCLQASTVDANAHDQLKAAAQLLLAAGATLDGDNNWDHAAKIVRRLITPPKETPDG